MFGRCRDALVRLPASATLPGDSKDRSPRHERKLSAGRHEVRVLASDGYLVALSIGDDQDRTVVREVLRSFQKIDTRLEHRSASTSHLHTSGDAGRIEKALVVRRCITKDHTDCRNVVRDRVACDRAERFTEQTPV